MSDENRVININPSFLKIQHNNTKTKRKKSSSVDIKVKATEKKIKHSTLKRNLLNMIRKNQEDRLKNSRQPVIEESRNKADEIQPKSEFEESIKFLSKLKKPETPSQTHYTFRNHTNTNLAQSYPVAPSYPVAVADASNPGAAVFPGPASYHGSAAAYPAAHNVLEQIEPQSELQYICLPPQPYSNLKNSSKPTYRNWMKNQTLKNKEMLPSQSQIQYEKKLTNRIKEMSEEEQQRRRKQQQSPLIKKRKRIVRRTYRVGKSKVFPKVSVLVSNKTLRNAANLEKQKLKETPIKEVKEYLRKQGFIKAGSSSPNDVLRQMYENAKLVCGEVHNRNPENLLYNYFYDIEEN